MRRLVLEFCRRRAAEKRANSGTNAESNFVGHSLVRVDREGDNFSFDITPRVKVNVDHVETMYFHACVREFSR